MAARSIIRLGDPTSHGGTVVEAFPTLNVFGKPASGIGHKVSCPKCKGAFPIVQGATSYMFMGKNVALEGMLTGCGAVLIATQSQATVDDASGASSSVSASKAKVSEAMAATSGAGQDASPQGFDLFFKLVSKIDGQPLVNWPYTLELPNGTTVKGRSDDNGYTEKVSDPQAVSAKLSVYEPDVTPVNPTWDQ